MQRRGRRGIGVVEVAPQGGSDPVVEPAGVKGGFRFDPVGGSWWWSPGVFAFLGYRPDQAAALIPSVRLLLRHRHPADRVVVRAAWRHLTAEGGLVAVHYRVLGADGVTRPVFVLASVTGQHGCPTMVTGVMEPA